MVISAGYPYARFRYGDGFYFMKKQIIWLLLGIAVMIPTSRIRVDILKRATPYLYALTLALLVLTLIIGSVGNGAQRWISIGPLTIQPSEIAKLALILTLALYFSENAERYTDRKSKMRPFVFGTLIPLLITVTPIVLVMLQHHLSCIIILGAIGVIMIFVSGADARYLAGFGAVGCAGVAYLALFTDYTKDRITVWRDPEAYKLTGGWQTLQGLMAIGSGGLFGVGFGKSVLKHCYVSEPANDMIFAILCEELGLLGAVASLSLFALLVGRGFVIAVRTEDVFSRLTAFGISAKCAIQVLLNVAVVTNSIPNTGISLPFFSYGGSSLVMLFFEMGVMLAISRQAKITK
jgi:cell division protein FtsW